MRKLTLPRFLLLTSIIISGLTAPMLQGQKEDAKPLLRGSLVEDRAARKLIEAGETRYDAGEKDKSIEIWKSVLERYPRSKHRFTAHMRLGNTGTALLTRSGGGGAGRLRLFYATTANRNHRHNGGSPTLRLCKAAPDRTYRTPGRPVTCV